MATRRSELALARAHAAKAFVTLAHKYNPRYYKRGKLWRVEEKVDGIRAVWNGKDFLTRSQRVIGVPPIIVEQMRRLEVPPLDGEFWVGRGQFQKTSSIVRKKEGVLYEWRRVRYCVFDMWNSPKPQCDRIDEYKKIVEQLNREKDLLLNIEAVETFGILNPLVHTHEDDIVWLLDKALEAGCEGLILREMLHGPYTFGRTHYLLKVKQQKHMIVDCIGTVRGEGKYEGMIGALVCKMPNGQTFEVGSGLTDDMRAGVAGFFIGRKILIGFFDMTDRGVPRFPVFKKVIEGRLD